MQDRKTKKNGGFSFIEVMLAVFVVSAGMTVVLGLMAKTLSGSMDSRDQIIAVLLAQEGAELVQNLRDNNWAQEDDAFEFNFPINNTNDDCQIDYNDTSISTCGVSDEQLGLSGGFYVNGGGTPTKFYRKIMVNYIGGTYATASKAEITSMVIWKNTTFPLTTALCSTSSQCAFTTLTLTRWGWN